MEAWNENIGPNPYATRLARLGRRNHHLFLVRRRELRPARVESLKRVSEYSEDIAKMAINLTARRQDLYLTR